MRQGDGRAGQIVLTLTVPEAAVLGLAVIGTLTVTNRGATPATVSARLNLSEGDVVLLVTCPDGSARRVAGAGGQPDTLPRQVTLAPGESIAAGVNLMQTEAGLTFPEPGRYVLRAEYAPHPAAASVTSAPVALTIRPPQGEEESSVADYLSKENVRLALTLAEADRAPDELRELARRHPTTLEGKLARLILAGGEESAEDAVTPDDTLVGMNPAEAASLITSVSTPFSRVGSRLAKRYVAHAESQDTAESVPGSAAGKEREQALRVVQGRPFGND
jgi:hypothetical protein